MENQIHRLYLQFLGAAREVTGSKILLSYKNKRLLIDCGLYQGFKELRKLNREDIPEVKNLDAVIITHAHIDHSGYLPRLVKQGFEGDIYCTKETAALMEVLLIDAAHLEEEDAEYTNKKGYSVHKPAIPLFNLKDVEKVLKLIKIIPREKWHDLTQGLSFQLLRSGHLLGSSFVQVSFDNGKNQKLVTFSGDLGSDRSNILKGPVYINESDFLVLEATYGDKVHHIETIEKTLISSIDYIYRHRGVLVIPAFAVGRTQELLYLLNKLEEEKKIPHIPLYIDSPMALKATDIYTKFKDDLKLVEDEKKFITSMDESRFKAITTPQESKKLGTMSGPFIVISAAGMLTGGRVLHHLKGRLPHRENAVLFVGFQAHGTKGRLLVNGIDRIQIHHEPVAVRAEVFSIEGLSAHADSKEIVDWLRHFSKYPTKILLNHGERDALNALKYRIINELGIQDVVIPQLGDKFILE
jgi:metallo-beta-lactamase family protein